MKSTSLIMTLILGMSGFVGAGTFLMKFKDAELKNQFGSIVPGAKGELVVDRHRLRFQKKNGVGLFEIPTWTVKGIFYTRVSKRRLIESTFITGGSFVGILAAASTAIKVATGLAGIIGAAISSSSRGQKHYMVLAFDNGGERVGAVEFKLHKNNYRSCLRAIAQVTGQPILYGLEGVVEPY